MQVGWVGLGGPPHQGDAAVWAALIQAGPAGAAVPDLVTTGLSRATVYRRIQALARAGRAEPTGDGRWRATTCGPT
jgi:hypothetical protein